MLGRRVEYVVYFSKTINPDSVNLLRISRNEIGKREGSEKDKILLGNRSRGTLIFRGCNVLQLIFDVLSVTVVHTPWTYQASIYHRQTDRQSFITVLVPFEQRTFKMNHWNKNKRSSSEKKTNSKYCYRF